MIEKKACIELRNNFRYFIATMRLQHFSFVHPKYFQPFQSLKPITFWGINMVYWHCWKGIWCFWMCLGCVSWDAMQYRFFPDNCTMSVKPFVQWLCGATHILNSTHTLSNKWHNSICMLNDVEWKNILLLHWTQRFFLCVLFHYSTYTLLGHIYRFLFHLFCSFFFFLVCCRRRLCANKCLRVMGLLYVISIFLLRGETRTKLRNL